MIDAYAHCGISKFERVESVLAVMEKAGVERAVLVQHLGEYDSSYLAWVIGEYGDTFAAVALVDSKASDWASRLAEVIQSGRFQGLRLTPEMLMNIDLGIRAAAAGLVLVLYTPEGVAPVSRELRYLAEATPDRPIVITHLGCPRVEANATAGGWELLELADLPNVSVTISGLGMFCPFPHRPLHDFVRKVIEAFTTHRIMWGSNFPVSGGASGYIRSLELVLGGEWGLDSRDIVRITEQNAAATFFT